MITFSSVEETFSEEIYSIPGKVIVLIPCEWQVLTAGQIDLLSKILNAVKLRPEGAQILTKTSVSIEDLKIFSPSAVLSFGTPVNEAPVPYKVVEVENLKVLFSDSLEDLDETKKKDLWQALRQLFKAE